MPRNIRWDESVKENALNLVEALLKQADNEFDDLELNAAVDVEWLTENKLRVTGKEKQKRRNREQIVEVGTRKEHLVKLVNEAGKSLNLPQRKKESGSSQQERELEEVQTLLDCLRELGVFEEEKNTRKNQGYWKFTLTLRHQTATREENLEVVRQKWQEHPKTNSLVTSSTTPIQVTENSIDWHNICRTSLEKQKHLTTNRLMSAKQMLFDINQICVDLALVERKQPDKRSGDDNPERSQLYKPDYEETQKLEYEEFLATVLKASPSNKISVIGEPGAGKTTLLQRIAFWILDNTDGLPIWIPLGNLPTPAPKLKDYLLNNWLEDAVSSVTPKIKAEFEELLTAGRVWLLLDGVDEMVANSGNPLSFIDNWIPGWCQQLSMVLTCRLNVWEANPHALNNFQTYRTLEFSQEKVNEFIEACFQDSNPALGSQLQQALNQPGKERIKDLVRNPLRLTLLCSTWHLREGKLPDTKAELYQQYVEEVYRWKKDEFPTTPEEREQLNAKLKELALAAIDKEENRFCLRHKFVEGVLGEIDKDNPTAIETLVELVEKSQDECIRIQAVHNLGKIANDSQNAITTLIELIQNYTNELIRTHAAQSLGKIAQNSPSAITALIELIDTSQDESTRRLAAFSLGSIGEENPTVIASLIKLIHRSQNESICRQATGSLQIIAKDNSTAIAAFVNLIHNCQDEFTCRLAAAGLGGVRQHNSTAITTLVELIHTSQHGSLHRQAAFSLGRIGKDNPSAIAALVELIQKSQDESTRWQAAFSLGEIDKDNSIALDALVELIQKSPNEHTRRLTAESLGKIKKDNPIAINALVELIYNSQDEDNRWRTVHILGEIGKDNPIAIMALVELIHNSQNEFTRWQAAESLGKIDKDNPTAITTLVKIIQNSQDESTRKQAVGSLKTLLTEAKKISEVVTNLKDCLSNETYENNFKRFHDCYEVIWHCAQNMTYPAFYQAWHQQDEVDKITTSDRQSLNQADLPQSLQSAIANDPQLSQIIHLICIDGSQFIERDRPAAEIYDQMLDQNCLECGTVPETMPALKLYWNSLKRNSNKRVVLVFYASSTDTTPDEGTAMPCPYSSAFLTDLSKFGREICVITEQPFNHIPLKFFTPIQPIADIVQWIRAIVLEN
jgi:HEAT repeat protein